MVFSLLIAFSNSGFLMGEIRLLFRGYSGLSQLLLSLVKSSHLVTVSMQRLALQIAVQMDSASRLSTWHSEAYEKPDFGETVENFVKCMVFGVGAFCFLLRAFGWSVRQ